MVFGKKPSFAEVTKSPNGRCENSVYTQLRDDVVSGEEDLASFFDGKVGR